MKLADGVSKITSRFHVEQVMELLQEVELLKKLRKTVSALRNDALLTLIADYHSVGDEDVVCVNLPKDIGRDVIVTLIDQVGKEKETRIVDEFGLTHHVVYFGVNENGQE